MKGGLKRGGKRRCRDVATSIEQAETSRLRAILFFNPKNNYDQV